MAVERYQSLGQEVFEIHSVKKSNSNCINNRQIVHNNPLNFLQNNNKDTNLTNQSTSNKNHQDKC